MSRTVSTFVKRPLRPLMSEPIMPNVARIDTVCLANEIIYPGQVLTWLDKTNELVMLASQEFVPIGLSANFIGGPYCDVGATAGQYEIGWWPLTGVFEFLIQAETGLDTNNDWKSVAPGASLFYTDVGKVTTCGYGHKIGKVLDVLGNRIIANLKLIPDSYLLGYTQEVSYVFDSAFNLKEYILGSADSPF